MARKIFPILGLLAPWALLAQISIAPATGSLAEKFDALSKAEKYLKFALRTFREDRQRCSVAPERSRRMAQEDFRVSQIRLNQAIDHLEDCRKKCLVALNARGTRLSATLRQELRQITGEAYQELEQAKKVAGKK